ncbi:MAG: GIY-YIG nuclease family protein [Proteobacteria bacterium]|nr:GIY-YIG nuclease family protein [Pseudomonadota bacterium]
MPGLGPGIHELLTASRDAVMVALEKGGWVYMVTNKPNGILYTGVTNDISRRIGEHRSGAIDGFSRRYGLKRLVFAEQHDDIRFAIQRERTIKHWSRAWKVRLVNQINLDWSDLYDSL